MHSEGHIIQQIKLLVSIHSVYELAGTYPTRSMYTIFESIRRKGDFSLSQYSILYSIVQPVFATAESPGGDYKHYCLAEYYIVFCRKIRFGGSFCLFFEDASCRELICVKCTDINESLMGWFVFLTTSPRRLYSLVMALLCCKK
jgi:hypothetical protein